MRTRAGLAGTATSLLLGGAVALRSIDASTSSTAAIGLLTVPVLRFGFATAVHAGERLARRLAHHAGRAQPAATGIRS